MKQLFITTFLVTAAFLSCTQSQEQKNKGKIISYDEAEMYWHNVIERSLDNYDIQPGEGFEKEFKMDISGKEYPNKVSMYKSYWRNDPVSQGRSGMCWSFATTSFYESEVYRLHKKEVKLSELYTVYWEYFEKAMGFIDAKGDISFDQGSEPNAVTRMYKKYGIVPGDAYTGIIDPNQKFHDHSKLYRDIKSYLKSIKEKNEWNKEASAEIIKKFLNKHLGTPPTEITIDGKKYSPKEYLKNYLQLNMDDYVDLFSLIEQPFYKKVLYNVRDNWWRNEDYYNVPLDIYIEAFKNALKNGFTASIGGDTSGAGRIAQKGEPQIFIIPSFDIPSDYIDDAARQLRFSNKTTTDDHVMHAVGYLEREDGTWFLVKDSGSGSRNNELDAPEFGYYFFHEDYIKLKILSFTVHKDAVKDVLAKFEY